jgi:hypothetical protein
MTQSLRGEGKGDPFSIVEWNLFGIWRLSFGASPFSRDQIEQGIEKDPDNIH